MTVFVVAHGAWSAAWAWKKMRPLLAAAGHELWTPTYTGLGERAHLASPAIDLDTHIADVVGVLGMEDLREVVLIAHSYGGMVATGVADRARERIAQLIYLDAFVPRDGQSLFDLQPEQTGAYTTTFNVKTDHWFDGTSEIVVPGNPDLSQLWVRTRVRDSEFNWPTGYQMPPTCSEKVDDEGVATIRAWIEQL